jgi:repressor LexA
MRLLDRLTPRQETILNFIKDEVSKKGYPPSVREIGEAIGLRSSSTVHAHLEKLEHKGYIRRDPTKPRAIEITDPNYSGSFPSHLQQAQMVSLPVLGRVTAGAPILAEQNIDEYINVPADFTKQGANQFCLRVKGDSMIDAGILDGDMVLVRQQNNAENGEIIVAMMGDEATVKRFFRMRDKVKLQPENPSYEPIYSREVVILGKVVAVFRFM